MLGEDPTESLVLLKDLCIEIINKFGKGNLEKVYKLATRTMLNYDNSHFEHFPNEFQIEDFLIDQAGIESNNNVDKIVQVKNAIDKMRAKNRGDLGKSDIECLLFICKLKNAKFENMSDSSSVSIKDSSSNIRWVKEHNSNDAYSSSPIAPNNRYDSPFAEPCATSSQKGSNDKKNESLCRVSYNDVKEIEVGSKDSIPKLQSTPKILSHSIRNFGDINAVGKPVAFPATPSTMGEGKMNAEQSNVKLIMELTYCFLGIAGQVIVADGPTEFRLRPNVPLKQPQMILRLMKIGTCYKTIIGLCDILRNQGVIGVAVVEATQSVLQDFRNKVGQMHDKLEIILSSMSDRSSPNDGIAMYRFPTIAQMIFIFKNDLSLLQYLCDVLSCLRDKRGGQILSSLTFHTINFELVRDDYVQAVNKLFHSATKPFCKMLYEWITKGTLDDPYEEFFVKALPSVSGKNAWEKEYTIRKDMLPDFITENYASLIIQVGRWTNFLYFCKETPKLKSCKLLRGDNKELLRLVERSSQSSRVITDIHNESSKLVLETLNNKFNLKMHLKALRKFMLLGQGDFVQNLIKLLQSVEMECLGGLVKVSPISSGPLNSPLSHLNHYDFSTKLNKPAKSLDLSELNDRLKSAIGTSNAQHEDEDVLCRIHVKMFKHSESDMGWDCFNLLYDVPEPITTMLKLDITTYGRIFTFLWKIKRAQFYLANMSQSRVLRCRNYSSFLPESISTFTAIDEVVMEMTHSIKYLTYYFQRDLIEKCWIDFISEVEKMKSVQNVAKAHSVFIEAIQDGCFLSRQGEELMRHVRIILDSVTDVLQIANAFEYECESKVMRIKGECEMLSLSECSWHAKENERFSYIAKDYKIKFQVSLLNHQECFSKLLMKLWNSDQHSLQLLSTRIDFNEFYKKRYSNLSESLMFANQPAYAQFSQSLSRLSISSSSMSSYYN